MLIDQARSVRHEAPAIDGVAIAVDGWQAVLCRQARDLVSVHIRERGPKHEGAAGALVGHRPERALELRWRPHFKRLKGDTERLCRRACAFHEGDATRGVRVPEEREA